MVDEDKMKTFLYLVFLSQLGCHSVPEPMHLRVEQVHAGFQSAPVVATESGYVDLTMWLAQPYEISFEPGNWLQAGQASVLVTLDIEGTSHASGLVHQLVAVFDPATHERLSPAFHYVADHLTERERVRYGSIDWLRYMGHIQQGRYIRDVSGFLTFEHGSVNWLPAEASVPAVSGPQAIPR